MYVLLVIARPEFFSACLHRDASDNSLGIAPRFAMLLNHHYEYDYILRTGYFIIISFMF